MSTCSVEQIYGIVRRKNVVSVFVMSLALLVFSVLLLALENIIISDKNNSAMILIIVSIIISLLFLLISIVILRNRQKNLYKSTYSTFWISFYLIMAAFAYTYATLLGTLIILALMLVIASLIPVFVKEEFIVFVGGNILTAVLLSVLKKPEPEIISFVYVFICLCSLLSYIRYKNCMLNTRYRSELKGAIKMSETDKLTGLLNRRGLERNIESLWPHWKRGKCSVAFLLIDIDYFKKYNDEFGHHMGDDCIKTIGNKIYKSIRRKTDFAARVGGEEYFVCLSGIEGQDALKWARVLKNDLDNLLIKHSAKNFLPYVTVSMGLVCERPSEFNNFDVMYVKTDKELYLAKERGRACLVFNGRVYDQRFVSDYKNIIVKREKFG